MATDEYELAYSPDAEDHLRALKARQRTAVFDAVEQQLRFEPTDETRNRKRMRPNPLAPWELRIGELRVYYDVSDSPTKIVTIVAVGVKERNRVTIGGKEIEL